MANILQSAAAFETERGRSEKAIEHLERALATRLHRFAPRDAPIPTTGARADPDLLETALLSLYRSGEDDYFVEHEGKKIRDLHNELGSAYFGLKRLEAWIPQVDAAMRAVDALVAEEVLSRPAVVQTIDSLQNKAIVLTAKGCPDEAMTAYAHAVRRAERYLRIRPSDAGVLYLLAETHERAGEQLVSVNRPAEAAIRFAQAAERAQEIVRLDEGAKGLREAHLRMSFQHGEALSLSGDHANGLRLQREALSAMETFAAQHGADAVVRANLERMTGSLARCEQLARSSGHAGA